MVTATAVVGRGPVAKVVDRQAMAIAKTIKHKNDRSPPKQKKGGVERWEAEFPNEWRESWEKEVEIAKIQQAEVEQQNAEIAVALEAEARASALAQVGA